MVKRQFHLREAVYRFPLFLLLSLTIIGCLLLAACGQQSPSSQSASSSSGQSSSQKGSKTPPVVITILKQQLASGLHLSVDALSSKLQPASTSPDSGLLQTIAQQQGVTPDQLHTLELSAYTTAYGKAVSEGVLKQADADVFLTAYRQMPPGSLNTVVTTDYLAG